MPSLCINCNEPIEGVKTIVGTGWRHANIGDCITNLNKRREKDAERILFYMTKLKEVRTELDSIITLRWKLHENGRWKCVALSFVQRAYDILKDLAL